MSSISSGGITPASVVPPPKQIRFVNNEGHPPAKRRRINAACRTCRKRKTRCDGKRPLCSTCTDNNHVCLGYADGVELLAIPRGPEKHNRHDDQDHYSEEEEKETSSGSFTQRSPQNPAKQEYSHRPSLETPTSADSRGYERVDTGIVKDEFQGISTFQENDLTAMGKSPRCRLAAGCTDKILLDISPPVQVESHRVPYFRYFGPTAIVPGYKAMVVAVPSREHRRSTVPTPAPSPGSVGHGGGRPPSQAGNESRSRIETPTYDPDPENQLPVNRLIIHLVETFFVHIGCNYPFLKQNKFVQMVEEKRVDAILVNAVCALAARFSDHPLLTISRDRNITKPEYGSVFASRAKAAVVHTFPCPSVAAVQACLLLAYEGFGSDEDSALWMYLGCAIRMAQDLGLQKLDRVKNQARKNQESNTNGTRRPSLDNKMVSSTEAEETEKEHIDTLWAVFMLDRVISSGTGRAVTLKDEEFELAFPEMTFDVDTGWPAPFPALIRIIHLYGRVSDLINNIRSIKDMTPEKMEGLSQFERKLTALYQKLDQRLTFNAANFQHYVKAGQGTNFILVHFWFHTLIMLLHQPMLLHAFEGRIQQLLPNSRELSMSSAKTIADILAFAELIDPRSFIGNPFTSQPIYIAACAFLMESVAHSSQPTSRDTSPPRSGNQGTPRSKISRNQKSPTQPEDAKQAAKKDKHSLLATAANQNYQRCYKALEQLEKYWAGARYILTALDQKAKGIWDPETYTLEEMESTKLKAESQMHSWRDRIPKNFSNTAASPKNIRGVLSPINDPGSPIAGMAIDPSQALGWSLSGITNSPNSNLAFLYQPVGVGGIQAPSSQPPTAGTLIYDPIRQSLPETNPNLQPTSYNPPYIHHRHSSSSSQGNPQAMLPPAPKYSPVTTADPASTSDAEMLLNLTSPFSMSPSASGPPGPIPQHNTSYERSTGIQSVKSPNHNQNQGHSQRPDNKNSNQNNSTAIYDFGSSMSPYSGISRGGYTGLAGYGGAGGLGEMMITSQDIDMSALGGDMMPWLQDYLPSDMMNFFDSNGGAGAGSD